LSGAWREPAIQVRWHRLRICEAMHVPSTERWRARGRNRPICLEIRAGEGSSHS
jgi:hypothetical protein